MQRVLDWLKKKGDQSVVQYSRFGLPGEETDDRPPPTTIHVAAFNDDDRQFMCFGTHAQKSAVVSAGVGICVVIFVFLSVFFEFDWYHHRKGVDMSALFGLVMFLLLGVLVHWYVIKGIQVMQSRFLVPFIIVYAAILFLEFLFFIFTINHWIALSYVNTFSTREPGALILLLATFAVVMLCQGGMMFSVMSQLPGKKAIHQMEMRIVEKSKQQYPGIRVVYGNDCSAPTVTVATESVSATSFPNPLNAETGDVSPPPSYDASISAPQRTILNGREEV